MIGSGAIVAMPPFFVVFADLNAALDTLHLFPGTKTD